MFAEIEKEVDGALQKLRHMADDRLVRQEAQNALLRIKDILVAYETDS